MGGLFLKKCSSLLLQSKQSRGSFNCTRGCIWLGTKFRPRAACGGLSVLEESLDIILCSLYFFVFFFSFLIYIFFVCELLS